MYCKVCGEELKPNAKFCGNCGAKVVKEAETIPKADIKKTAEPVNKKVEIEETKTSKKKTIAGVVASLAIIGLIFSATGNDTSKEANKQITVNKKVTTAIPKEHREFLAKIGLQVPADDKIDFTDEKGKLHYYRIPSQDGEQGVTIVLVNDNGAINEVNVSHKSKTCYGSFKLVANGNVLGTFSDKLAEHKLADAQFEQEAKAREAQKAAEAAEQEADARRFANYLGCTVEEYKEHFGPMLSTGFTRGRLDTWYNDSSSTSVNEYGHGVQYVLHLVGRGQNGKRVYVSVYEYSDRPGDYQVQVMNTNHE
ncbi:zinc ribbon domain-containing protein [uncultured Phascolarctobacterium sp.]|uniref:zinc-ribbon domain-containing protein n=1 Tax=uncultured Phascolarctobacterium sp. TaxID=512296 RepID=UPI0025D776DF|nr:zinc ribbon domain-containing protein [uncultured Phascolarctobacterium sp.]